MKTIIQRALQSSYTYTEYRNIVTQLLSEGKVTGHEQSADLLHYAELNEVRMNRLDKTMQLTDSALGKLQKLQQSYIWLVLSEGWCGDAAQLVPIIDKMAQASSQIEFHIALRDDHDDLMQHFLTNGSKSIPKLIVLKAQTLEVLGSWGPRPAGAAQLIIDYKAQHGVVDQTAKTELQLWYLHDKGASTQEELADLMLHCEQLSLQTC